MREKTGFLSHLYIKVIFSQDRLGINTGKALKTKALLLTDLSMTLSILPKMAVA
eukprot:COSAG06_NODE_371_length_16707_cov_57.805576_22_plen_54_part_00